jgi:integrase
MSKNTIKFTKAAIENLSTPTKGERLEFYDTKTNHLLVRVSSTGRKTFQVYRWHDGKPSRVTIGCYPELSIEQVRAKADQINAGFARGENPADKKRAQRQEMTFADLFQVYLERHAKPRKRTWQEDENCFKNHLSTGFGKKKLSKIKKSDIAAIHARIGKNHPTHANRVLALISSIFGRGIEYGLYEGANPCVGIRRFPEQSRDRFLNSEELSRFFSALEMEENATARDSFLVGLLTGARKSNVLSMRWSDIDFSNATWRIGRTKNGTAQTIPLVGPVLEILQDRRKSTSSFFVFAGPGKKGHIVSPFKAWVRIRKAAGLDGVRIHDLRRTMGSWQAKTGASLPIIGKSLNHKSASTTSIYARLDLDPVRTSMDKAVTAMLEAANTGKK